MKFDYPKKKAKSYTVKEIAAILDREPNEIAHFKSAYSEFFSLYTKMNESDLQTMKKIHRLVKHGYRQWKVRELLKE